MSSNPENIQATGQGVDEETPTNQSLTGQGSGSPHTTPTQTNEETLKKKEHNPNQTLITDRTWDSHIKLFRVLKVITAILDNLPKDSIITQYISWPLLLICDAIRLILHLAYKKKYGDNPTRQKVHYIGGPKAIRLRAGQLIISALRLVAHVLMISVGSVFPVALPILSVILNVLRAASSTWTIIDDTTKFFDRMKETFKKQYTPSILLQKLFGKSENPQEKQNKAFFLAKVLFFLIGAAAIAVAACAAGPAAPLVLGAIAIALGVGSAAGYTTCSITEGFLNLAKEKKAGLKPPSLTDTTTTAASLTS